MLHDTQFQIILLNVLNSDSQSATYAHNYDANNPIIKQIIYMGKKHKICIRSMPGVEPQHIKFHSQLSTTMDVTLSFILLCISCL